MRTGVPAIHTAMAYVSSTRDQHAVHDMMIMMTCNWKLQGMHKDFSMHNSRQ
jgi:hypothetical protein